MLGLVATLLSGRLILHDSWVSGVGLNTAARRRPDSSRRGTLPARESVPLSLDHVLNLRYPNTTGSRQRPRGDPGKQSDGGGPPACRADKDVPTRGFDPPIG